MPTAPEVLQAVLAQLNQIGVLVLILVTMGSVAGERLTGTAAVVLSKPIGRGAYFGAKLAAYGALAAVSLLIGVMGGAYYTGLLIGPVFWGNVLLGTLLYLPTILLAIAVTLFASATLPSPLAAGGTGLLVVIGAKILPQYLGSWVQAHSPSALSAAAASVIGGGTVQAALAPLAGTIVLTIAFAAAGYARMLRAEF